jgi:asparagine synthase (glutamine-hydrolysing)
MCGITGILSPDPRGAAERARLVSEMTCTLAHRGPDDSGSWTDAHIALGHTRLSIIDLSAAGHQPFVDETGRYVLVYNGEIYNYLELRERLAGLGHRFRTHTDTEVVLQAWIRWGPDALSLFNGMWAFALWDRESRELIAARDRAGKKPFYYALTPAGTLHFASEVKALRASGVTLGINPQAVFDFLTQGTYGHLGADGFFAGIQQVPAAHWIKFRLGERPTLARYWDLPRIAQTKCAVYDDAFTREFRELLTDAVRLRLRADVPVGATLSGGLDSSTLVLLIDRLTGGAPLHLFTSQYPGARHDESAYFNAVVARLRNPVVHRSPPLSDDWPTTLLRVLDHQEEPFGDTSIFAHFQLMQMAHRAGVPVVISGQGGDELLLGYPSMVVAYLGHRLARRHVLDVWRELAAWSPAVGLSPARGALGAIFHALPLGLRDRVRRPLVHRTARRVHPALRRRAFYSRYAEEPGRSSLESYLAQVFTRFAIPHLTHYDDRNAMAFSVEGRMPFLDYRLIEMMFAAPPEAWFRDGFTKRVLREAFADLLPDEVRLRRDKVGFHTPLATWLRHDIAWVRNFMSRDRLEAAQLLVPDRYLAQLSRLAAGETSVALEVWRGLIVHLWIERFGLGEAHVEVSSSTPLLPATVA